jgi:hypothetical protein
VRYFYVNDANQAVGPVEAEALEALLARGVITGSTRVSREGGAAWLTYAEAFLRLPPALPVAPALPEPARPLAVTVFGLCNIIFGLSGLFCLPLAALGALIGAWGEHADGSWLFSGWKVFSAVLGLFLSLALLASGVGLYRFRKWGRTLALAYCLVEVAHVAAGAAVAWKHSPCLASLHEGPVQGLVPLFLAAQLLAGLAYPCVMFVVLRFSAVRDAFQNRG